MASRTSPPLLLGISVMILSSLLTWTALIANHALIERLHSKDRTAAPSGARPKGAPTPPGIVFNV